MAAVTITTSEPSAAAGCSKTHALKSPLIRLTWFASRRFGSREQLEKEAPSTCKNYLLSDDHSSVTETIFHIFALPAICSLSHECRVCLDSLVDYTSVCRLSTSPSNLYEWRLSPFLFCKLCSIQFSQSPLASPVLPGSGVAGSLLEAKFAIPETWSSVPLVFREQPNTSLISHARRGQRGTLPLGLFYQVKLTVAK